MCRNEALHSSSLEWSTSELRSANCEGSGQNRFKGFANLEKYGLLEVCQMKISMILGEVQIGLLTK